MEFDGFHPKVSSWRSWKEWLEQACTSMSLLIPKNCHSERPIALMPSMLLLCEALRAPQVSKVQQKYRIDWDAADGRSGGSERRVRENFDGHGKLIIPGGRRRSWSSCGVGLGDALQLLKEEVAGAMRCTWRSRSRLSRPFCHGQGGVVSFFVLCCRTQ